MRAVVGRGWQSDSRSVHLSLWWVVCDVMFCKGIYIYSVPAPFYFVICLLFPVCSVIPAIPPLFPCVYNALFIYCFLCSSCFRDVASIRIIYRLSLALPLFRWFCCPLFLLSSDSPVSLFLCLHCSPNAQVHTTVWCWGSTIQLYNGVLSFVLVIQWGRGGVF